MAVWNTSGPWGPTRLWSRRQAQPGWPGDRIHACSGLSWPCCPGLGPPSPTAQESGTARLIF